MKSPIALSDVLNYSKSLNIEKPGVWEMLTANSRSATENTFVVIMLIVVVLFAACVFSLAWRDKGIIEITFYVGAMVGAVMLGSHHGMADSQSVSPEYLAMEKKWQRELAYPYVEQLPVKSETQITSIEYDYDLEVSTEAPSKNKIPVRIATENGKELSLWVEVVKLDEAVPSILTFNELEKDLVFHELSEVFLKKGYYDGKLYTNQEI